MNVRVLAFARLRELLGFSSESFEFAPGATARDVWTAMCARAPQLTDLAGSTRLAINGKMVDDAATIGDGDEIALLPPVGGG